jgi:DNA-binding transcriptional LysR family regulator
LPRFRQRYPQVLVDVHVSNRIVDFAEEQFDLAIRGRARPTRGWWRGAWRMPSW